MDSSAFSVSSRVNALADFNSAYSFGSLTLPADATVVRMSLPLARISLFRICEFVYCRWRKFQRSTQNGTALQLQVGFS
jgi:hypothetical protein